MFEVFFTDSCLRYRIEVINGIDFYGLGFGMVRGESMGKWISQWMQKGETASVLITNTKLQCQKQLQKSRNALIPVLLAAQICFFPTFRVQFL